MAQEDSPTTKATNNNNNLVRDGVRSKKQAQHILNKTLIEEWHNHTF